MRVADLSLAERFERLTFLQFAQCGVYTVIAASINIVICKVLGWAPDVAPLCTIWLFNCMLCDDMGYMADRKLLSFVTVVAASFVVAVGAYIILPNLAYISW